MNLRLVLSVLAHRRRLRQRERWAPGAVATHRARALAELRAHATERSRFYKRLHRGLEGAPLEALPIVTKAALMEHFDDVVTDRRLRLADLEAYLAGGDEEPFRSMYWVAATSGSSGSRAVVPSNFDEWSAIVASYARANEWAGIRSGLTRRITIAVVSSTTASHQSSRVAQSLRSPFVATHRFDAGRAIEETVAALDALRPDVLVAYASMLRILAEEQLHGRLQIRPKAVNCSSEVLTPHSRALAAGAWGAQPFEVYAATETGGIAAECAEHRGMHLFEDLVITESVDRAGRPVADGVTGDRLVVSVLSSRTLPLIRYEISDRVRISSARCPCGRPFRLVECVEGRSGDVLDLPGASGARVSVHSSVLHRALDGLAAVEWQVRQDGDRIAVLVAGPRSTLDGSLVASAVRAALRGAGAEPVAVDVMIVGSIPTGPAGKRPLVVVARAS